MRPCSHCHVEGEDLFLCFFFGGGREWVVFCSEKKVELEIQHTHTHTSNKHLKNLKVSCGGRIRQMWDGNDHTFWTRKSGDPHPLIHWMWWQACPDECWVSSGGGVGLCGQWKEGPKGQWNCSKLLGDTAIVDNINPWNTNANSPELTHTHDCIFSIKYVFYVWQTCTFQLTKNNFAVNVNTSSKKRPSPFKSLILLLLCCLEMFI